MTSETTSNFGLPWAADETDLRDCEGNRFADVWGCAGEHLNADPDRLRAAYIVKAVNNHERLVELLQAMWEIADETNGSAAVSRIAEAGELLASLRE